MFEEKDFIEQIERFKQHDNESQQLYDSFKGVFDIAVAKAKNAISMNAGLRDLSEAARSLSSIRGDCINATSHTFNAKMKVSELTLKKERADKDDEDQNNTAALMRQLTETFHKQNPSKTTNNTLTNEDYDIDDSHLKLKERVNNDLSTGNIRLNSNEKSMKYDFNGVTYKYDMVNETMVVIDRSGNIILDYPLERIPDDKRFKRVDNGVPIDASGRTIQQYVG